MPKLPEPKHFTLDEISTRWMDLYGPQFTPEYIKRLADAGALDLDHEGWIEFDEGHSADPHSIIGSTARALEAGKATPRLSTWLSQAERDRFEKEWPPGSTPVSPLDIPEYFSDQLATLLQAAREFWSTADPLDHSTHSKNETVISWLQEQGLSAHLAKAGASIIRPKWAKQGRPS